MGGESWSGLAGYHQLKVSHEIAGKVWPGDVVISRLGERWRTHSQAHSPVVGMLQFLWVVKLKFFGPHHTTWACPSSCSHYGSILLSGQTIWEKEKGRERDKGKSQSFYNQIQKCFPMISAILYSFEATHWVQPTLKWKGLQKGVNTRKWGSLGTILETANHIGLFK